MHCFICEAPECICAENEIARNSCLRRDDVLSVELDKAIHPAGETGNNATIPVNDSVAPVPTDQALIEGLARVVREEIVRQYRDEDRKRCPAGIPFFESDVQPYLIAQAALLYMQQHVRGLVVALEAICLYDPTPNHQGAMACHALSSLPPVLRGGE